MSNQDLAYAFPYPEAEQSTWSSRGMSLRDYFAAAFLAGFARTYNAPDAPETKEEKKSVAILCYRVADAMLEARKQ